VADISLALLGSPIVERDASPVVFDTKKAVALLAVLAVAGREQSRERLAAQLWPDSDPVHARGSLRRTLSVTAAAVGECLLISRSAVTIQPGRARVDVADFATLIARPDAASLERGVRLYRDDFLAGFSLRGCPEFEDWQSATADRLRQDLAAALERLVAACVAEGDLTRALDHARRWLSLDPLHEPAHQALIRLQAWTGQRSAALRQYRALVRVLSRELAVSPLPETTRLYDDVRAGRLGPAPEQAAHPAARPAPVPPGRPPRRAPARPATTSGRWPLIGRAAELRTLAGAWRAAGSAGAGGQVVAVAGEAGCGKSRLIEEFWARVEADGGTTISGRCHDGESGLPFALSADLLRAAGSARPGLPALLPPHVAAMIGRLTPELAAAHRDLPEPPLSSPVALTRMYAALAATLLAAARPAKGGGAGAVLVEDVHWADGPSLDLLAYLIRRLADWPLLLVISWRPEADERLRGLRAALAEADDAGRAVTVEPQPFSADEIADMLRAAGAPPGNVARMLAETRGLPLLVREYTDALGSAALEPPEPAGEPPGTGDESWSPPASVRGLLSRRLQAASEPALQMLSAAAVLGSGFDVDLLRTVSGRGESETVESLDEALGRFLLTEIPPQGGRGTPSYDFPYEALRRVSYDSATLARRRLLHGRAADALADRHERDPVSARAAVVAGHLQRAGREAEAAQWWWRAAARARELYAHAEAQAHLSQAVALGYPEVPGSIALGDVLTVLGRYHEALAEYETAAAGSDGDNATSAAIEHKLAEVHHRLGDWALADAHLAASLELLAPGDPGGRARVQADRAVVAYRRGANEHAAELGAAALAAARRADDPAAIAQALDVLGMLAARAGDAGAAEAYLRESLEQARELPEPGAAVAALNNLARLLADTGRTGEALENAREALALGSELGDQHRVAALHTNLADLLHQTGRHDAALSHLKEAARRFAAVDPGAPPKPEIWTLVEWLPGHGGPGPAPRQAVMLGVRAGRPHRPSQEDHPHDHQSYAGRAGRPGRNRPRPRPAGPLHLRPGRAAMADPRVLHGRHRARGGGGRGARHRPPPRHGRAAVLRYTGRRLDQPRRRDAADPAAPRAGPRFHPHRSGGPHDGAVVAARQGGGAGVHGPALHRHLPDRVAGVREGLPRPRAGRAQGGVHRGQREPVPRLGGRHGRLFARAGPEHHPGLAFPHRADAGAEDHLAGLQHRRAGTQPERRHHPHLGRVLHRPAGPGGVPGLAHGRSHQEGHRVPAGRADRPVGHRHRPHRPPPGRLGQLTPGRRRELPGGPCVARRRHANTISRADYRSPAPPADPGRPTWDTTGHADSGR
jgi:DNA-binding SARP family transcriptional activator/tetratricopeptide (TPR) repeat protein